MVALLYTRLMTKLLRSSHKLGLLVPSMHRDSTTLCKDKNQFGWITQPFKYGLWYVAQVRSGRGAERHGCGNLGAFFVHLVVRTYGMIVFNGSRSLYPAEYLPST